MAAGAVLRVANDLVTRPFCATDGTTHGVFVDWLTIRQEHPAGGLPRVDSGCVMSVGKDGEVEWLTARALRHAGSFETSVNVRCDGHLVTFSGNVSRFGRSDNLFGFAFSEALRRINAIMAHYRLPAFTPGRAMEIDDGGQTVVRWTGARVSRIDLAANFETGSAAGARAFMQWLGRQHVGRHEGRALGQGETVTFGAGSRRANWKAYIKDLEMRRHGGGDERLIKHCEAVGLVRFEGTIKSNQLTEMGCAYLGDYERGYAMGKLIQLYEGQAAALSRARAAVDDLAALPKALRATARDYLAGMDCAATMCRRTFYRHRKQLLGHGIDIAVCNVRPFQPRVRVIALRAASVPEWYSLNELAA